MAVAGIGYFEDLGAEWAIWFEFLRHSMSMWFVLLMVALFAGRRVPKGSRARSLEALVAVSGTSGMVFVTLT